MDGSRSGIFLPTKKHPDPPSSGSGVAALADALDFANVGCLETFWASLELELNLVTLVQILIAVTGNGLVVHEHVFATRTRNKPEAFGSVEPLYCTLFHGTDPFFYTNPQPGGHGAYIEVVCLYKKIAVKVIVAPRLRSVFCYGFVQKNSSEPAKAQQRCTVS
jgi:hypothetical protein